MGMGAGGQETRTMPAGGALAAADGAPVLDWRGGVTRAGERMRTGLGWRPQKPEGQPDAGGGGGAEERGGVGTGWRVGGGGGAGRGTGVVRVAVGGLYSRARRLVSEVRVSVVPATKPLVPGQVPGQGQRRPAKGV